MKIVTWLLFAVVGMACAGCGHADYCPAPAASSASTGSTSNEPPYRSEGNPYDAGTLGVRQVELCGSSGGPPVPLRIHTPDSAGVYAVVVLQHGFMARNICYGGIADHLASHGFVVVLPQMYEPGLGPLTGNPTAAEEARCVAHLLTWLGGNLSNAVGVTARTDLLGLSGHSRGGKVAWTVMAEDPSRAKAIAGIDPVDGTGGPGGDQPRVVQGPFGFPVPSLVIGTGLGGACAPAGDNHEQFYAASASPAWHIIATNQGHGDMLDEGCANLAGLICESGPDRSGMRRLTAGLLTAFFRAHLQDDADALVWLYDAAAAPVPVTIDSK